MIFFPHEKEQRNSITTTKLYQEKDNKDVLKAPVKSGHLMMEGKGDLIAETKTLRCHMVFVAQINLALSKDIIFPTIRVTVIRKL